MEPNSRNKQRRRKILGIERDDYTGTIQRYRDKKNISYKLKDGKEVFAKYVSDQGNGAINNLEGIRNEVEILHKLEDTEITPKVIQFKEYPSHKKARLVTEKVSGTSLDRLTITESEKETIIENCILSTATSLQIIHERGIYIVDINEGTFLVNQNGEDCKIVDFEFAIDSSNTSENQLAVALNFRKPLKYKSLDYPIPLTVENVQRKEMYIWAKTMLDFIAKIYKLGDLIEMEIPLENIPQEEREKIQEEVTRIREKIMPEIIEKATRYTQKEEIVIKIKSAFERRHNPSQTFEEFVNEQIIKESEKTASKIINTVIIKLTLRHKLEKFGIKIPSKIISFLERCLDLDPNNRPNSFNDIL